MSYELLSSLYYKDKVKYENEYEKRINSLCTCNLSLEIKNNPSFICITPELTCLIEDIFILSNKLNIQIEKLPTLSKEKYFFECLVEEILLTNNIEGVHSTRREVEEILDDLPSDKIKRFKGLVQKYQHLIYKREDTISLKSSKDLRDLYDEIVLPEIENNNIPDGEFFRKGPVSVISSTQKEKHRGISPPEENIIKAMDSALSILDLETVPNLVKIAVLHYYIGYVHPFYDGNGRLSRFISSYLISQYLDPSIGLRLSYIIKNKLGDYYKSFEATNSPKNKGELTFFTLTFLSFIKSSIVDLIDKVGSRLEKLYYYKDLIISAQGSLANNEFYKKLLFALVEISIFTDTPIDIKSLSRALNCSETTTSRALYSLIDYGYPIIKNKFGRKNIFTIDMEKLDEVLKSK